MRARKWLVVGVGVALAGALACRDRVPPQSPPTPHDQDTSDMGRAGPPTQQGIPAGNNGEGSGFPGEQSAVKELPAPPAAPAPAPAPK